MLTSEENEVLTKVGPGTPGGELLRRYWHPIAVSEQMGSISVRQVRILGEDLVLYRDRRGELGLVGDRCIHRAFKLKYGVPENDGLRCPYHGWLYNGEGQCIEMPLEPADTKFKEKIRIKGYPVEELGGLVWAYLGPEPVPVWPSWDLFVGSGYRAMVGHQLPCNWLQVAENRADLGHAIYLHGRLFQYVLEQQGRLTDDPEAFWNARFKPQVERLKRGAHPRWRPLYNEFGLAKGQMDSDQSEDLSSWTTGINPILFPYLLMFAPYSREGIRRGYQLGVPIDDHNTWHIAYHCWAFPEEVGVPVQDSVPYVEAPLLNEEGDAIRDYVLSQDMIAWWGQGELTDRTKEHLGQSDTAVIAYRKLLRQQIERVQDGADPINVFRDEESAYRPELRIPGMNDVKDDADMFALYRSLLEEGDQSLNTPKVFADERRAFTAQEDYLLPEDIKEQVLGLYDKTEKLYRQRAARADKG
jgi:5,5'-dehydrodivanillate O-demethylase